MSRQFKTALIVFFSLLISFFFAEIAGRFYEQIIGRRIAGNWIGSCPECMIGFLIILCFSINFFFFYFKYLKKIYGYLISLLLIPIFALTAGDGNAFLFLSSSGLLGAMLGQLVFLLQQKFFSAPAGKKPETIGESGRQKERESR